MEDHPNKELWVARTEYLWEDLQDVERLLGRRHQRHEHFHNVTHGSEGHKPQETLSLQDQQQLCCALKDEIDIYGKLLLQAINLQEDARRDSLDSLAKDCGATSWGSFNKEQETICLPDWDSKY